ncbi:MAG: sensor histidine kinase [Bacteroidales bacterium]
MIKKRRPGILSKISMWYLLIILASFIISGLILKSEATKHMNNILERRLTNKESWVARLIEKKPERLSKLDYASVKKADSIPEDFEPVYSDTSMVNNETGEKEIFRKKINYVTVRDTLYKIEVRKTAEELYRFRDDIFEVILMVILLLIGVVLITNYFLSNHLFAPFKQILKQMADYKIGKSGPLKKRKTSTREFLELQDLLAEMQNRIEKDYQQLRQYTENMSHELQTPLSIIQNKSEQMLAGNNLSPGLAEKIKTIYSESRQLSRLGSTLNLITKIENQEFENIEKIRTAPVINEQITAAGDFADNRRLSFHLETDENQRLTINPDLFNILLRNLIKNAIYYANKGSTISIVSKDNKIIFSNEGKPADFPEEDIFTRFTRGKDSTSLGLGLAIVKQICHISGLHITYEYNNGKHIFIISKQKS